MSYVAQRHHLAKNTLPLNTTSLLRPKEPAASTSPAGCQVRLWCERNCAVLTLGLLGHVIRLDGRDLDAPGGSDVDHEGRHHAVVMVVRRQGCGGARTAGQATTTAAPASTPARLRPSPTPAAPRSLHHGDGRRQRLPSGRKKERTKRVLEKPRASTTQSQSLSPRASSPKPRHNDTPIGTLLRGYTLQASGRWRKLNACALAPLPFSKHRLLDIAIGYVQTPPPPVINASDYRQLETKRKWLLGRCLYHRSKSFLPWNASTAQYHA